MSKPWTMRGFSNEHAHLDKAMLVPGIAYVDAPPPVRGGWTRERKALFTKEDIYRRAESALERMIRYGTTYVRTHVDVDPVVGLKGVEAILELQANYASKVVIDITAFNQEGFERYPETAELLDEALRMGNMGIGGHTLADADGKAHLRRVFDLAEKRGAPWIEFHTDESGKPEHFLLPALAQETMRRGLSGKVYAIHCNSLANVPDAQARHAIERTAEAGLHIVVCPTAVATRALTRTKELQRAGLRISLGSDNMADLFNPLGGGNMLQYAQLLAYVQRFYEQEEMQSLLDMLLAHPVDEASAARLRALNARITYGTNQARELLTDAPAPTAAGYGEARPTNKI